MSLAEELKKPVNQRTRICTIAIIKSQLSKTDNEAFETAIQDMSIPSSFIARALVNEGYKVNGQIVARHRRKECNCVAK